MTPHHHEAPCLLWESPCSGEFCLNSLIRSCLCMRLHLVHSVRAPASTAHVASVSSQSPRQAQHWGAFAWALSMSLGVVESPASLAASRDSERSVSGLGLRKGGGRDKGRQWGRDCQGQRSSTWPPRVVLLRIIEQWPWQRPLLLSEFGLEKHPSKVQPWQQTPWPPSLYCQLITKCKPRSKFIANCIKVSGPEWSC